MAAVIGSLLVALPPFETVGKVSVMPRGGKRLGRPTELGVVTTTPLLPTAPATNGYDSKPLRTNPQHKHTVEELYEMRQILLATLPPLRVNDHEGIICLLLEARLQTCLLNGTTLEDLREAYSSGCFARFQGL